MNLSITNLKTERQWRSVTGMDKPRFEKILSAFQTAYERHFKQTMAERQANNPQECVVTTYEELLLFTLFTLKADLGYDLLGFVSGFDGSNAHRTEEMGLIVLQSILYELGHTPNENFRLPKNLKNILKNTQNSLSMVRSNVVNDRLITKSKKKCTAEKKSPHN